MSLRPEARKVRAIVEYQNAKDFMDVAGVKSLLSQIADVSIDDISARHPDVVWWLVHTQYIWQVDCDLFIVHVWHWLSKMMARLSSRCWPGMRLP